MQNFIKTSILYFKSKLLWFINVKAKVKEIVYEEIECTRCLNRMRKLIKDFPVHTIKDVARLIKGIIFVVIRYTQLKINKMIKG